MITEQQLREKLRKISALFEGATTPGERHAAAAAIERVKKALAGMLRTEPTIEMQFSLSDRWQRRLFSALCRRYGLEPFRYKRQRYTTVMIRVPRSFVDKTLWPEYLQIKDALDEYLAEATERIIRAVDGGLRRRHHRRPPAHAGTRLGRWKTHFGVPGNPPALPGRNHGRVERVKFQRPELSQIQRLRRCAAQIPRAVPGWPPRRHRRQEFSPEQFSLQLRCLYVAA